MMMVLLNPFSTIAWAIVNSPYLLSLLLTIVILLIISLRIVTAV